MDREGSRLYYGLGKIRTMSGIKRKEYLQYLAETRDREFRMKDAGYQVVHKSIKEIRAEFESKFGSIFFEM